MSGVPRSTTIFGLLSGMKIVCLHTDWLNAGNESNRRGTKTLPIHLPSARKRSRLKKHVPKPDGVYNADVRQRTIAG